MIQNASQQIYLRGERKSLSLSPFQKEIQPFKFELAPASERRADGRGGPDADHVTKHTSGRSNNATLKNSCLATDVSKRLLKAARYQSI